MACFDEPLIKKKLAGKDGMLSAGFEINVVKSSGIVKSDGIASK